MPLKKVDKNEWLKHGLSQFSSLGLAGINVEKMSKALKCNKSSFYWHFKTRQNFLEEVIQFWQDQQESLIQKLHMEHSPSERFKNYLRFLFRKNQYGDLLFFIQREALHDKFLKKVLRNYNQQNNELAFILIIDLGYDEEQGKQKTDLLLHFHRGWYEQHKYQRVSKPKVEDAMKLVNDFIDFEGNKD